VLADQEEALKLKPPRRGLLDKWEEIEAPLQWLLDNWDVVVRLGEQLQVTKGKGGIYLAKNFRSGEWGAVSEWLKWPQMKLRVVHLLEFCTRIAVEQRWSRGENELMPYECSFRCHEVPARMVTHRLPLVEALGDTDPLPKTVFKRARSELAKLSATVQQEEKVALKEGLEAAHRDLRFWMAQWTTVPELLGMVTDPILGPELVRQIIPIVEPGWGTSNAKKVWKKQSAKVNIQHRRRIKELLTPSWHSKFREGLDDMGTVEPTYAVIDELKAHWSNESLQQFKQDWLNIALSARFTFQRSTVSVGFYDHFIDNYFVRSMSNEKVTTDHSPCPVDEFMRRWRGCSI
jgi:hypothetical protein